ncbi:hypothetical protein [Phycobacter sp. K97]|uniref:hypothetical protein n=1 Tax=Phycobacter sedimenti TaxID=3133977 RepID=UPI00311D6111
MKAALISFFVASIALTGCVVPEETNPAVARQGQQDFVEAFALFDNVCLRAAREGGLSKAPSLAAGRGFAKRDDVFYRQNNKAYTYYSKPASRQNLFIGKRSGSSMKCGVEWKAETNVVPVSSQAFFQKMFEIQGREIGFFTGADTNIELGGATYSWSQGYSGREKSQVIYLYD